MATNTTNFNFKKPDESDFYSVQDQNNNWDKADAALKDLDTPTFEDYSGSTTVPDAATAINNIKSKGKLSTILSNMKAAFKGACLIGQIVNNCVTNNAKLPLSAAQGKALMELYTQLNSDLTSVTAQLTGTPVLLGPGSILSNIKWYIENHAHVRGSFPYEPDPNNSNRVSDLPPGAEAWGRVEWFKLASDEYRVILYTENNVKTYHRLIVSGSWSGDWVEK
ncbi:hypothetical protein [Hungatella effluvii]|uniref:hypothetical protein n=1 Tax=Hungatella effluvii TaxID=1096246 RepID=UPI001F5752FB|nr:hypothetical protein [Hungatella effluvii]